MAIKLVSFRCGYVESGQTGLSVFSNENGFKTPGVAIKSLAAGLLEKYQTDFYSNKKKSCCQKAKPNTKFCSDCGHNLLTPEFDVERYQDWLRNFGSLTCDSLGCDEISDGEEGIWHPWVSISEIRKFKDNEIFEILECGENILVDAVKDKLPKDTDLMELGWLPPEITKLYE